MRRKVKGISTKIHPELFKIMENERKKLAKKGINANQMDLSAMIAKNLNDKRRGLGLMKNGTKKNKKR